MDARRWVAPLVLALAGLALGQTPEPKGIPASLGREKPEKTLSPKELAKKREEAIKALKETIQSFDPDAVTVRRFDSRWLLQTRTEVLKDFGADRDAAMETARLIKELQVNQMGTVAGARPPFDYWLRDGKAAKPANARLTFIPINDSAIHAEQVGGTWVITDGARAFYDFGSDAAAAKTAAVVYDKYGFNQLAVIGSPNPVVVVPFVDATKKRMDKLVSAPKPNPLGVLNDAARTSLLLPGNISAGPKSAFHVDRLVLVRQSGEWYLRHGEELVGKFGNAESTARQALRALKDAQPTEWARIGEGAFPIFLANGQGVNGEPLGVVKVNFRPERLKLQKVRDSWWLFEELQPIVHVGSKEDADLLLKVVKIFDLKTLCVFGRPEAGGLRLLTVGR